MTEDGKTEQEETEGGMVIITLATAAGLGFLGGVGVTLLVQLLLRLAQVGAA